MIARISTPWQSNTWQKIMAEAITSLPALYEELSLPLNILPEKHSAFPVKVPKSWLSKIEKNNPNDPLLLQVLPQTAEIIEQIHYVTDPLSENTQTKAGGLIQKYQGRILWVLTQACALHCRYCFRQYFPYTENIHHKDWFQNIKHITEDISLNEVILSGGDPLSISDKRLISLIQTIADISHIQTIRIHTRLPVVIPERITTELANFFAALKKRIVVVLHVNHPNELDEKFGQAMRLLQQAGITLLNQSVLLKNINDNPQTLITLSRRLFSFGVLPYYLNMPDKVKGTQHFDINTSTALEIIKEIQTWLPGYLVPKLVQEIPGTPAKQIVSIN